MKIRKYIAVLVLCTFILVLCACKKADNGAKEVWEKYVSAINEKDINKLASTYYAVDTSGYKQFVNSEKNKEQLTIVDSIKTVSFEPIIFSDISTNTIVQKYTSAKVNAKVELLGTNFDLEFIVYLSKTDKSGWFFTGNVCIDPLADSGKWGNLPNDLWLRSALHEDGDFLYKPIYKLETDSVSYSGISISKYSGNEKNVEIPSEFEGLPVTTIKKFAFMKTAKIFEVTFSNSKMRSVSIPDTVTTIEEYAFFECKKLKELNIPSSVTSIGEFAFASCTGLKKISFILNDSDIYTEEFMTPIESKSDFGMTINGARNMYVGDIINLVESSGKLVNWSVDKTNVASIDADKGTLIAKSAGTVVITAALKSDPTVKATVTLTVSVCPELTKVQGSAFERCSGLQELYIYAKNPNSFRIAGTAFKLPENVKIYVPKGSKEMYANASNWANYKENIFEIPE